MGRLLVRIRRQGDHYMTVQLLLWSLFVLTDKATRAASVKASFTPRFFMAEHSVLRVSMKMATPCGRHTQVSEGFDSFGDLEALVVLNQGLFRLCALVIVVLLSQIALEGNQDKLNARTVLCDFGNPFGLHVLERVGGIDAEAEHDSVCVIVAERS